MTSSSTAIRLSIWLKPKLFFSSTALFLVSGLGSLVVNELPDSPAEFSCGGGPFSFLMASLVSTTCRRDMIHLCCEAHDGCYDQRHLNQTFCDQIFCGCLAEISSSAYCEQIAQPSLCLATEVFGHMFHWSAYENGADEWTSDVPPMVTGDEARQNTTRPGKTLIQKQLT